jgi:hypothetical protein
MTLIRLPSPARPGSRKYINPVQSGLQFSFLGDSDDPARNWALDQPDGVVIGTPTRGPDDISWRFKGLANFVQTQVTETANMTFILVARTFDTLAANATRPQFFGNFTSPPQLQDTTTTTFGSRFWISVSGAVRFGAGRGTTVDNDVQADIGVTVANHQAYQLFTCETSPVNKLTSATTSNTATSAVTDPRFPARAALRLGSGYLTQEGECDILLWRAWSRALTAEELAAETADARAYLGGLGVTV